MIRALLLDLDDTLLDDRSATQAACRAFFQQNPDAWAGETEPEAFARRRRLSLSHWARFEAGAINFAEQRRARVREFLAADLDDEQADAAFEPYRLAYEASWRLVQGCAEFLSGTAGLPKIVITNGDRGQQLRKVEVTGLSRWVDGVVTPADAGVWKPDPAIFHCALSLLKHRLPGLMLHEVLMLGDDPDRDIAPARALGLSVFQIVAGDPRHSLAALKEWGWVLTRPAAG